MVVEMIKIKKIGKGVRMSKKEKLYKHGGVNNINMPPGGLSRSPDDCYSKETLVFIDAGFLSKLSGHLGKGKYLVYDLFTFISNLTKKQELNYKQIFYYTAPPFQSEPSLKGEIKKREKYDRFIKKLLKNKNITIREGRCQRLKINGKFIYKQKAVDSLMIMDLMRVPIDYSKIKKIIVIASDSDFVPIIQYLRKLNIEIILYTHYSKKRRSNLSRSNELLKVVNQYVEITKKDFDDAPLNEDNKGGVK